MTLQEAIRIKSLTGEEFSDIDPDEIREADRLSFEALKRIFNNRATLPGFNFIPLPGETEE